METNFIWRNCLIKELNIPSPWINLDGRTIEPQRQDLFWIGCSKIEVATRIIPLINNILHKCRVADSTTQSQAHEFHFMINRNLDYVQYYPYMNMQTPGSLWESFVRVFTDPIELKSFT